MDWKAKLKIKMVDFVCKFSKLSGRPLTKRVGDTHSNFGCWVDK